ncbi:MAG: RNA polymerase sigma factor [Planctomycetes bacterium]|nr:RNA polymerase sigma factor [Planctomycetota bacterium]
MSLTDEQLMIAVGKGDIASFEQIVIRYQQFAWRIAYRYTDNRSDAEEISQEAFVRVLDSAKNYRRRAKFSTYLYKILANLCLDHARKRNPQITDEFSGEKEFTETPYSNLQIKERDQAVRSAIDSLPNRQRLAVILRYYENLSYAQIADAMDSSIKAVERLLARARHELEHLLKDFS